MSWVRQEDIRQQLNNTERRIGMINNIPDSLKAKLKGKEKQLEKAVLELKGFAKEDLVKED